MKERRGRITCHQHLIPLVLNQKLPDDEEGVLGVSCAPSLVQLMEKLPQVLALFVHDFTWKSIMLCRIVEKRSMLFQTKYHVSLSPVKLQRG